MAFYVFAAHVGRRDPKTIAGDPFYGWNLCDHLAQLPERTKFVKLESLSEDLGAEGLTVELPRLLEQDHQSGIECAYASHGDKLRKLLKQRWLPL